MSRPASSAGRSSPWLPGAPLLDRRAFSFAPLLASLAILFVFVEKPFNTPVKPHAAL
jgi:hypothetical protein